MQRIIATIIGLGLVAAAGAQETPDPTDHDGRAIAGQAGRLVGLDAPEAFAMRGERIWRLVYANTNPQTPKGFRFSVAAYQLAKAAIAQRRPEVDEESQWLIEGLSYVLVEELLRREFGDRAAREFTDSLVPPREGVEQTIMLTYWKPGTPLLPTLNAEEERLQQARTVFAYREAREALGDRGVSAIADLLEPTEQPTLIDHASEITGVDLRNKMRRYQSFENPEEGRQTILEELRRARSDRRHDEAVSLAVRLMEVERDDSPKRYALLAALLHEAGQTEQALTLLRTRGTGMADDGERGELLETLMDYAKRWGHTDVAQEAAEYVLRSNPNNPQALKLRMQRQHERGKLIQARVTAEQIVTIDPGDAEALELIEQVRSTVGPP